MLVRVRHGAHENKYCPISTKASTSASYTEDINSSFILGSIFDYYIQGNRTMVVQLSPKQSMWVQFLLPCFERDPRGSLFDYFTILKLDL